MFKGSLLRKTCLLIIVIINFGGTVAFAEDRPSADKSWSGLGQVATNSEITSWNIDVSPDGSGLPSGSGSVQKGRQIFLKKCAHCHGPTGTEGPMNRLVGGKGTLKSSSPLKTVGSYWPYATTLYDYIYRAMPFTQPQSLTPDEVYSLVAWILYQNEIIQDDQLMSQTTLPLVQMPNKDGFTKDPRPDIQHSPP